MKKILAFTLAFIVCASAALLNMTRIGTGNGLSTGTAYQYRIVRTNSTSSWLLIPKDVRSVAVYVDVASNSARVEFTTVRVEDVESTGVFLPWPLGDITNDTADSLYVPVTAIRLVASNNIATMFVRAQ